ncbi:DUF1120 domain-containing protein [Pseudomonas sp. LF245]
MKDSLAALTGALLIVYGTVALAASSVDLSVKGAIIPSVFALDVQDNRSSIAGPSVSFVLGRISPTNWIAVYLLTMENVSTDDPAAYPIYSIDNGSTWIYSPQQDIPANTLNAFGNRSSGTRAPVPLSEVSLDLVVQSFIFPKNYVPEGETIALDGSATFELRYL